MVKFFRNGFVKTLNFLLMVASMSVLMSTILNFNTYLNLFDGSITFGLFIPMIAFVVFTFTFAWYIKSMGRRNKKKNNENTIHLNFYDHICTELQVLILAVLIIYYKLTLVDDNSFALIKFIENTFGFNISLEKFEYLDFNIMIISFISLLIIMCPIGSLIKNIKNGTFFTNTLLYDICLWIDKFVNHITRYDILKKQLTAKVVTLFILAIIPVVGWIILLVLGIKWKNEIAYDIEIIKETSKKLKNGDYDISNDKQLNLDPSVDILNNLCDIKENINNIVDERVKTEKDKIDMIMNASYDLKNPLESILENIKILEKDPELSTNNKKIIEIIKGRAERINTLSNEISIGGNKESKETIQVNLGVVDIFSFLAKGLGEIEQEMKKSDMNIKLNIKKAKILAVADENLLWRAFENVIKDVFKHGQKGTNVFISIEEENGYGIVTVKNEIKDELKEKLNISNKDFIEKYLNDSDKRSSLVVADNLMNLQGGRLEINLKDNYFAVTLIMKNA